MPERDTVSQVMTASARPEVEIATLTTATREKVGSEHVETLGKERRILVSGVCYRRQRRGRHKEEDHKVEELEKLRTHHDVGAITVEDKGYLPQNPAHPSELVAGEPFSP